MPTEVIVSKKAGRARKPKGVAPVLAVSKPYVGPTADELLNQALAEEAAGNLEARDQLLSRAVAVEHMTQ
jgi:hypothetical protein